MESKITDKQYDLIKFILPLHYIGDSWFEFIPDEKKFLEWCKTRTVSEASKIISAMKFESSNSLEEELKEQQYDNHNK